MQPELFNNLQSVPSSKSAHPPLFPHHYFRVRVAYEDLIFSTLVFVLVLLAGFCLGVERGRRLESHPVQTMLVPSPVSATVPTILSTKAVSTLDSGQQRATVPQKNRGFISQQVSKGKSALARVYVIQLASYREAKAAQAEADRLRRKGFDAKIVNQGKYFELRVGGYRLRSEAATALTVLKETYQDGFIKKLSSG